MWNRTIFISALLVLAGSLIGCPPRERREKPTDDTTVNDFGDVSNLEAEAVPEREADYSEPRPEELRRMKDFLERNSPKEAIVKSLETPWGETIDCVDVRKQPALAKPDMENHKLQLQPSGVAKLGAIKARKIDDATPAVQDYLRLPETCPQQSVPIRRMTIDDLARFSTLADFLAKHPRQNAGGGDVLKPEDLPEAGPTDKHQYAVARRYIDNWGAESVLNVWRPYTESSKEFTLSQIWVARGSGDDLETVEAGWQKYKRKYGDWNSRLFIYFTPDNYGDDGCYNLDCGAFVQTSNSVYIGGSFADYSSHEGAQHVIKLLWYKDGESGHWWLRYGDTWVGYYPRRKFDSSGLRSKGARITFGGEVTDYRTSGHHTRTDMGSGYMPNFGWAWSAYQRSIRYVDTSNYYRPATDLYSIVSDDDCYDIDVSEGSGSWGVHFYFGGRGYGSQCE